MTYPEKMMWWQDFFSQQLTFKTIKGHPNLSFFSYQKSTGGNKAKQMQLALTSHRKQTRENLFQKNSWNIKSEMALKFCFLNQPFFFSEGGGWEEEVN